MAAYKLRMFINGKRTYADITNCCSEHEAIEALKTVSGKITNIEVKDKNGWRKPLPKPKIKIVLAFIAKTANFIFKKAGD